MLNVNCLLAVVLLADQVIEGLCYNYVLSVVATHGLGPFLPVGCLTEITLENA